MVRDLDFRVRQVTVKPPPVIPRKNADSWWLWAVIAALLVAAAIGVWQYRALSTLSNSSSKTPTVIKQTSVADATPSPSTENSSILSSQTSAPLVQIYDSGAGEAAVNSLVDKLKSLGYKVDNLDRSQFEYDRTYIRYRAGMQAEAQKIQSALPERLVSLKEVKSAGLFDILILYGLK